VSETAAHDTTEGTGGVVLRREQGDLAGLAGSWNDEALPRRRRGNGGRGRVAIGGEIVQIDEAL